MFRKATDQEKNYIDIIWPHCGRTIIPVIDGTPWWNHLGAKEAHIANGFTMNGGSYFGSSFMSIDSVEEICPEEPLPIERQSNHECQTPRFLVAQNIGPWSGNRSGYDCKGPSYGNGTWAWRLTGATETSKRWDSNFVRSWEGPLIKLKLLKVSNDVETWEVSVWGWQWCEGKKYTDINTKSTDDKLIDFTIGQGTMTLEFGCKVI